jgi:REP element-mobilizing transposase RayT
VAPKGTGLPSALFVRYSEAIPTPELPRLRRDKPWAHFLTFTCHGSRFHGDQRGSVDRNHNGFGAPFLYPQPLREAFEVEEMGREAMRLEAGARRAVRNSIQGVCRHEGWTLLALHVRATHVHVVVKAEATPECVLAKLKAYATRDLNKRFGRRAKRWTRHGSTRRLWSAYEVDAAVDYVLNRQGEPMEVYEFADRWSDIL